MELHHYTKATTLPSILQSGKIRFTRADKLDDLRELPFDAYHLSREFFFISSWVKSDNEISGLWRGYADDHRGVRLSFKSSPFKMGKLFYCLCRPLKNPVGENTMVGLELKGAFLPATLEVMFGKGYVLDVFADENTFGGYVQYVKDPKYHVRQFISTTPEKTVFVGGLTIARIKSIEWKDQSEYRFILMASQGPDLIYQDNPKEYENEYLNLLESNVLHKKKVKQPDVEFIDLPFDPMMLDQMIVTLGSKISADDRDAVLSAIHCYAPKSKITESAIEVR